MDYLIQVLSTRPLRLHFSFHQPEDRDGPAYCPRMIRPLGYFVRATIRSLAGEVVFETTEPKVKLKLNPAGDESYLALDPGYSYGAVLTEDAGPLPPGEYVLSVEYSNREFTGTASRPVGELRYSADLDVSIDDGR